MAHTVPDLLTPITTPDRIDFELTRIYWEGEPEAWRELKKRGVKYVHVSTRYFGLTSIDSARDRFSIRGNTIIGPRPAHILRLSALRRTFLYRLRYDPGGLDFFKVIYSKFDPEMKVGVLIYELKTDSG